MGLVCTEPDQKFGDHHPQGSGAVSVSYTHLGVHGIWNFTNCEIAFPGEDVVVESVHFSDSLLALSYMISQREDGQEQEDGKDET